MNGRGQWRVVGAALGALLLLGDFGCTGSEDLTSETGSVTLEINMSPTGAGRYEQALFKLVQVTIRPTDPVADQTLGAASIGLIPNPLDLNLVNPSPLTSGARPISDGEWRLDKVTFAYPNANSPVRDFDPVNPPTSCVEGVLIRTNGLLPPPELNTFFGSSSNTAFTVGPFSPPFLFSVPRLGNRSIKMNIDGPRLAALYENAFTCRTGGTCGSNPSIPAPCMSAFALFTSAQVTPLITFE